MLLRWQTRSLRSIVIHVIPADIKGSWTLTHPAVGAISRNTMRGLRGMRGLRIVGMHRTQSPRIQE